MKKILSKLRKMIKCSRNDASENVKSHMPDGPDIKSQPDKLVIDANGLQIVITHADVDHGLLSNEAVRNLNKGFGINIGPFINGVAEVSWKLKPYKFYEIDYGVPDWERDCIAYAMIDEKGKFLEKFQYTDYYGLKRMRGKAEKIVSGNESH